MKLLLYLLFAVFYVQPLFAKITLSLITQGDRKHPTLLAWPIKEEVLFQEAALGKSKIMSYKIEITIPDSMDFTEVTSSNYTVNLNNKKLYVFGYALNDDLELKAKDKKTYLLNLKIETEKGQIIYDQCSKNFPEVIPEKNSKLSFDVGVSCFEKKDMAKGFTISLPSDATLLNSTFFDLEGKGERWRYFEVPNASQQGGILGSFEIKRENEVVKLNLVYASLEGAIQVQRNEELEEENRQLKKQLEEKEGKNDRLQKINSLYQQLRSFASPQVGFGTTSMKFTVKQSLGTLDLTDTEKTFLIQLESEPIFSKVILKTSLLSTLLSSSGAQEIDMIQAMGSLGYQFVFSDYVVIPSLVGIYHDYKHRESNLHLQAGHFGLTLDGRWNLRKTHYVTLKISSLGMGSQIVKSNSITQLEYKYNLKWGERNLGVGALYEQQSLGAVNETGLSRQFNDNKFLIMVTL